MIVLIVLGCLVWIGFVGVVTCLWWMTFQCFFGPWQERDALLGFGGIVLSALSTMISVAPFVAMFYGLQ